MVIVFCILHILLRVVRTKIFDLYENIFLKQFIILFTALRARELNY